MPIVCCPSALTDEERVRSRVLRAELAAATAETAAVQNGYAFQFSPDTAVFQKAAEWVSLERRCCPFLTFELVWSAGSTSRPCLKVTGPEGTSAFMAEEMPQLPVDG